MRSIKHLPRDVYSSLHSSVIFFDLTRVVEELVSNSIDAGATKVMRLISICLRLRDLGVLCSDLTYLAVSRYTSLLLLSFFDILFGLKHMN